MEEGHLKAVSLQGLRLRVFLYVIGRLRNHDGGGCERGIEEFISRVTISILKPLVIVAI